MAGFGAGIEAMSSAFKSGREDGRFVETAGFYHAYLKNLKPRLRFDPTMSTDEMEAWRGKVREKLKDLLDFPEVESTPEPKRLWEKPREGYRLEKWEAYPEPYSVVLFYILVPDGVSVGSPAPMVMCFSGANASKENLAGEPEQGKSEIGNTRKWLDNRMAYHYARNGFIAVSLDSPGTHETDSELCSRNVFSLNALWMGRPYESMSTFQKAHILHWLAKQPHVDRDRIAVSGHSLGAKPADMLGVLYPDLIKAVVHNDFLGDWQERLVAMNLHERPPYQVIPGIFQWFDYTDIEAALAPTPLLFTEGGRAKSHRKIREAYVLAGTPENVQLHHCDKYADPASRKLDDAELPDGLSDEEYFAHAYVVVSEHRFRHWHAVPWLRRVLGMEA